MYTIADFETNDFWLWYDKLVNGVSHSQDEFSQNDNYLISTVV